MNDYNRHPIHYLAVMLAAIVAIATLLLICSCTTYQLQREVVRAEKILDAQTHAWDQQFDRIYDACESAHPDRGPERDACVVEADRIDRVVGQVTAAAVAALRAFWIGVSIGEDPAALRQHVADIASAVAGFPISSDSGSEVAP